MAKRIGVKLFGERLWAAQNQRAATKRRFCQFTKGYTTIDFRHVQF